MTRKAKQVYTSDVLRAIEYRKDVARRRKAKAARGVIIMFLLLTTFSAAYKLTSDATGTKIEYEYVAQDDGSYLVVTH